MAIPVARFGDPIIPHCSPSIIAMGSTNVYTNFLPTARVADWTAPHLMPVPKTCVVHSAPIAVGSTTVHCNLRPVAYMGSAIATCTAVAVGSPTVLVGA